MSFAPPIPLPPIPGATQSAVEWEFAWLDQIEGLAGVNPLELYRIYNPLERIVPTFYEAPTAPRAPVTIEQAVPEPTESFAAHDDPRYPDVGDAPLPVETSYESPVFEPLFGVPSAMPVLHSVLPRPVAEREPVVYAPTVWPEHEIIEFPEGDYPEGSIFAPGGTWGPGTEQHDLDTENEPVALFDGWFGDIVDVLQGQIPGGQPQIYSPPMPQAFLGPAPSPTAIPGGYAASPPGAAPMLDKYGRPCRRRRRRRLLTNSDLKDLAALKTITGNNDALKMAVIKAVR